MRYIQFKVLNHPSAICYYGQDPDNFCVADLEAYTADTKLEQIEPDYRFYLSFDNYPVENQFVFGANKYNHFMSKS